LYLISGKHNIVYVLSISPKSSKKVTRQATLNTAPFVIDTLNLQTFIRQDTETITVDSQAGITITSQYGINISWTDPTAIQPPQTGLCPPLLKVNGHIECNSLFAVNGIIIQDQATGSYYVFNNGQIQLTPYDPTTVCTVQQTGTGPLPG